MKVTQNKIDDLNLEITVEIAAADYAEIERKKLADARRKADFKGFRKGMVPASLVKKVYGGQILAESVNQLLGQALDEHIKAENLRLLGEPLGSEKQPELVWEDGNDFTFVFDAALSPEISLEVGKDDVVPSYSVTISAKDKAPMIESMKKYYEEQAAKPQEEGAEPVEPRTDEQIEEEVTERMRSQYRSEAEWRLTQDMRKYVVEKAGVQIPEAFLKRWLIAANEGKVSAEDVEKEFPAFVEDFKWQLVRGYLMNKWDFKIGEDDLREAAESYVRYQYAMYGMGGVPDELVKEMAVNMLQDQKQIERLAEQVEDRKVMEKLKEEMTVKSTKISAAKFREL